MATVEQSTANLSAARDGFAALAKELGAQLVASREALTLSQAEAARRCGLGAPTLLRYEHGLRLPSPDSAEKLIAALNLDGDLAERLRSAALRRSQERGRPPRKVRARCRICREPIPVKNRFYCDDFCKGMGGRKGHPAATPLARFLDSEISQLGVTASALAAKIGLPAQVMSDYLMKGGLPREANYERMKEFFGSDFPTLETHSDRLRRRCAENLRLFGHLRYTPEANRKRRQTWVRRPKKRRTPLQPGVARRLLDSGLRPEAVLSTMARSNQGRAAMSLARRLRWNPTPTRDDVSSWAREYAPTLDLPPQAVVAMWRPMLQQRGIEATGRPPLDARYRLIKDLMASASFTPSGRLRAGFWPSAAKAVAELEGRKVLTQDEDGRTESQWYRQYVKRYGLG